MARPEVVLNLGISLCINNSSSRKTRSYTGYLRADTGYLQAVSYCVPDRCVQVGTWYHTCFFFPSSQVLHLHYSPSSNSDPGSHGGPSSPLPTTVHAFTFIVRIIQQFLPSSTCVELYLYHGPGALRGTRGYMIGVREKTQGLRRGDGKPI